MNRPSCPPNDPVGHELNWTTELFNTSSSIWNRSDTPKIDNIRLGLNWPVEAGLTHWRRQYRTVTSSFRYKYNYRTEDSFALPKGILKLGVMTGWRGKTGLVEPINDSGLSVTRIASANHSLINKTVPREKNKTKQLKRGRVFGSEAAKAHQQRERLVDSEQNVQNNE